MRLSMVIGLATLGSVLLAPDAGAIPAWARKYNMNCSGCHYPAAPRLNTVGLQFRWNGYRMPNEIGEQQVVDEISNFLSMRGRFRYTNQTRTATPTQSGFSVNDATIFLGGSFLRNWAGFFEFEREAEDAVELVAHVQVQWGTASSSWGFRGGPMHWFSRTGLAGFDRPAGISTPAALAGKTTGGAGAIPFSFANDQLGLETFYLRGRTRLSVEVLNGIDTTGVGDAGETMDAAKDLVATASQILDDVGSGVTAMAYYGTIGRTSPQHFMRAAVSANKIWQDNELEAGYVYSQDRNLPAAAPNITGSAYFVGLQRYFRSNTLTLFGRLDHVDPNTSATNDAFSVYTLGAVLPVGTPQYVRLALEGSVRNFQGTGVSSIKKLQAELMLNF